MLIYLLCYISLFSACSTFAFFLFICLSFDAKWIQFQNNFRCLLESKWRWNNARQWGITNITFSVIMIEHISAKGRKEGRVYSYTYIYNINRYIQTCVYLMYKLMSTHPHCVLSLGLGLWLGLSCCWSYDKTINVCDRALFRFDGSWVEAGVSILISVLVKINILLPLFWLVIHTLSWVVCSVCVGTLIRSRLQLHPN